MKVSVQAPISGVVVPLEQVPDPVFQQKMVGDGVAIDPTACVLVAPLDGEVIQLHPAHHAVTIRSQQGLEVLMHIGLDTVKMKGQGFATSLEVGDQVEKGQELISFEPDKLAQQAKSLLTMVIVSSGGEIEMLGGGLVKAGQKLFKAEAPESESQETEQVRKVVSEAITVLNPTGLHARPAAVLVNLAKRYDASIELHRGDDKARATSVVGILGLEVGNGDSVKLVAWGPEAEAAVKELSEQIRQGLGEEVAAPAPASQTVAEPPPPQPEPSEPDVFKGVSASGGLAVGTVFQLRREEIKVEQEADTPPARQQRELEKAVARARQELEHLVARLHAEAEPAKAAIFAAHQELLEDPDLLEIADSAIAKGKTAAWAWQKAYTTHAKRLASLRNELLAARANDLEDVGRRVLGHLVGEVDRPLEVPEKTVLIAEDLTPSDTATLDRERVLGFCTTLGGATSHVAILARSLGLPAIAGIDVRALDIENGTPVILDGSKGVLRQNPDPDEMKKIEKRRRQLAERQQRDLASAKEPAVTSDGHHMEIVINVGGAKEAEEALEMGAEGVGLLRSEFLFMERPYPPTEEEQLKAYSAVAKALGKDRPLVIRTLDVGGDKPLSYLPIPTEENPFLGQRGIRVLLGRPDVFRPQLRAILRASEFGKVHCMFPMVSSMSEWRAARAMLEEEREKLGLDPIPVGIMIEVPAAAMIAEQFAKEVDFFSVGTNDLTQYTLAMDRGHPQLASQIDGLSPAVLRLIERTVKAAKAEGKWVGVCGGIAGERQAVPLLVGLGVDELSVSLPLVPAVKALIRQYSLERCQHLAKQALEAESAAAVRALCPDPLEEEE